MPVFATMPGDDTRKSIFCLHAVDADNNLFSHVLDKEVPQSQVLYLRPVGLFACNLRSRSAVGVQTGTVSKSFPN